MEKLLGLGILVQVAACAVVGGRLLRLAARTRQAPELFLSGAFLSLGVVGYPLSILARGGEVASPGLLLIALAAQNVAGLCIVIATWRTFHPGRAWMALAVIALALGFVASLLVSGLGGTPDAGPGYALGFALRLAAFGWAAFEAIRYYGLLRRRLRIGLVDAVVLDRFRLWAVSTVSIVAGFAVFLTARLLSVDVGTNPWVLSATSIVGVVGGVSMWLAFFPPAPYLSWIASPDPTA